MTRGPACRRTKSCRSSGRRSAVFVLGVLVAVTGCSSVPEEVLLEQFFRAVAQEDRVSVGGLSMVPFPGGPIESWELVEIGPATEGPYRVPELREEEIAAAAARDEQFKIFYDFRQANRDALGEIVLRWERNPDAAIGGGLGEIAAELDAHNGDRRRMVRSLSEVQMALDEERRRAQRSLLRKAPVDYLTGNISQAEALVRTVEEGKEREYRFSLIRYNLQNQHGADVRSRWIIAAIEAPPGSEQIPEETSGGTGEGAASR